jgi:hypothetical protein
MLIKFYRIALVLTYLYLPHTVLAQDYSFWELEQRVTDSNVVIIANVTSVVDSDPDFVLLDVLCVIKGPPLPAGLGILDTGWYFFKFIVNL